MKKGFFLPVRKTSQGKPCFHYRDGFAVHMYCVVGKFQFSNAWQNYSIVFRFQRRDKKTGNHLIFNSWPNTGLWHCNSLSWLYDPRDKEKYLLRKFALQKRGPTFPSWTFRKKNTILPLCQSKPRLSILQSLNLLFAKR